MPEVPEFLAARMPFASPALPVRNYRLGSPMSTEKINNTIVTIGDIHYLWGIFLLIASARKAGMREPFLVGCKNFTAEARGVLEQLGDVSLVPLDGTVRSLACYKPQVMLQAETEYVTWADSDAFFTGNVSELLLPEKPEEIHFRMRAPRELPGLSWKQFFSGDFRMVPKAVLEEWRRDVKQVGPLAADAPRFTSTGSTCFCSLSLKRHRHFLEEWQALQERVLPERDVGVADRSLRFYPQLDESTLNACLAYLEDAPQIQPIFRMDKERERLFVHFIARPKPWEGWTKRAFTFFDEYVAVVEWAVHQGYILPGTIPFYLQAKNKQLLRWFIPWMTLKPKVLKRFRRFCELVFH